ncbi:MAG: hypothetical protein ACLP5H_32175 [Desulfomonilaceae bacterium]
MENNIKTIWFYDPNKVSKEYLQEVIQPLRIQGSSEGLMYILRNVLKPPYVEKEVNMLAQIHKPILIVHGRGQGCSTRSIREAEPTVEGF